LACAGGGAEVVFGGRRVAGAKCALPLRLQSKIQALLWEVGGVMAKVYRFEVFQVDDYVRSNRWATRERIAQFGGWARSIGEGVEVADNLVGQEIAGMTARYFDPRPPRRDQEEEEEE